MDTKEIVQQLVDDVRPVRRLSKPWVRVAVWLAITIPYLLAVILMMSPRPDLSDKIMETRFQIEQSLALGAGVAAAFAALTSVIPGWSRWPILAIAALVIGWLAMLSGGCVSDWVRYGEDGLVLRPDWICFPAIAMSGAVPAIAMVAMLRQGAPLKPGLSIALAGLAAAAIGNFGLRFFHPQDAGLMVLVWQFGSVIVFSLLAGLFGRRMLRWGARLTSA